VKTPYTFVRLIRSRARISARRETHSATDLHVIIIIIIVCYYEILLLWRSSNIFRRRTRHHCTIVAVLGSRFISRVGNRLAHTCVDSVGNVIVISRSPVRGIIISVRVIRSLALAVFELFRRKKTQTATFPIPVRFCPRYVTILFRFAVSYALTVHGEIGNTLNGAPLITPKYRFPVGRETEIKF
jgi:uncharacterized oligopeptide transporter (OPT) family protein